VRPGSEVERRRLNELFAELCAIASPFGHERACADRVTAELRALGLEVDEDGAGAEVGANAGNLLVRMAGRSERSILLCAHLDTVPHGDVPIEPICEDGGWTNRNEAILGADNKAAVAVMLALAHRVAVEGSPVGIELLFTVSEENALAGAKAFDASRLRSQFGYVLDHASPIGEIVVASPTYFRIEAAFHGKAAHAGIRPEDGRSAIEAAARAIAAMELGRLDDETTANIGTITGGAGGTNVVADSCTVLAEARSISETRVEEVVAAMVDHLHDAANLPRCACDLDVGVERLFTGYRQAVSAPQIVAAEEALRACGYTPSRIITGGGSDANALEAGGFPCANLANGTERNHETTERVSVAALEGMLDVVLALLDAAANG
jgi:tripeptide aminopeptidase